MHTAHKAEFKDLFKEHNITDFTFSRYSYTDTYILTASNFMTFVLPNDGEQRYRRQIRRVPTVWFTGERKMRQSKN